MGLLRLIQLYLFVAVVVMVLYLFNLAETTLLVRFDEAPQARSMFTSAIFRYSVVGSDGFNPCKKNGCSIYCELDGQTSRPCPVDIIVLKNLTVNRDHHFHLNVTTDDGQRNSSTHSWFIDTIPPTATIFSKQNYTNADKVAIDVEFSESCAGYGGGFKCLNSSNCDVIVIGPAHVNASSLSIIKAGIKYSLDIILSPRSTYARIVIKMENYFCTDLAGNRFTRTNGSIFIVHLDRRPVEVDLWTSVPSYELGINGVPRTVTATNKMDDLKLFLDFSSPVINSTDQILNAFRLNSGIIVPIHSGDHGNRKFAFQLKNISRTEVIRVELQAASVLGRAGTPVSSVAPLTFLYDCTEPGVWLSTSSPTVTKESSIDVIIEFTKPVFGFEASKVEAVGGSLTRFKELSRALYSLTVLADSQNVTVAVLAGKVYDISRNRNLASNQLQVKHYKPPAISIALHSFMSAGILATSLAAALLSLSSANLEAIGTLATRSTTTTTFSDPSMNLHGMLGHLQVFVLSDWLLDSLPVEYSETTRGLSWLIPREKLPWRRESSSIWPNHLFPTGAKTAIDQGPPFQIYPKGGSPREQQNVTIKNTPYGLTLDSSEYFTYFLREEPLSASNVVKRLESYKGWQDLEMNLFWLGVGGGLLLMVHTLVVLFLRWRTQTSAHGILSVPRFELFLLILMLPCISQSSAFVIRGGTTGGILTGALLLAIPAGLILSVCLFLVIAVFSGNFAQYKEIRHIETNETWYTKLWHLFTGRPTTGKWFYREGLPSSFLPRFGILFENRKGPPIYVLVNQNDPTSIPKWTGSGQNGIGRMRAVSADDNNEETKVLVSKRLLGCARSSYIILDLMRRVSLGILSGFHSSRGSSQSLFAIFALIITAVQLLCLFTLKPYIRRGVHVVESVCLLCEAVIFGLSIAINCSIPLKESHMGYLMLGFLFLAFVSQIINEWYAMITCILRLSPPQKNSFKYGLKLATKGLLLPLLLRKHWSGIVSYQPKTGLAHGTPLSPQTEFERRDARAPVSAMTASVVPVLSPGSPGPSNSILLVTAQAAFCGKKTEGEKRLEPKNEMKRLRQLARASLSGGSKCEEGSTSYGFRV